MSEAQIKKFTEQLAQDPKSRVFVPLADLYRRAGRFEEATSVAKEGLTHHPDYVAGKVVLARIYLDSADRAEAEKLLIEAVEASPDNLLANRLLADLYLKTDNEKSKAKVYLQNLLSIDPMDHKAHQELERIEQEENTSVPSEASVLPENQISENDLSLDSSTTEQEISLEIDSFRNSTGSTPIDLFSSDSTATVQGAQEVLVEEESPLNFSETVPSMTLAELYEKQGHHEQAQAMYRALFEKNPHDPVLQKKLSSRPEFSNTMKPETEKTQPQDTAKVQFLENLLRQIAERRKSL